MPKDIVMVNTRVKYRQRMSEGNNAKTTIQQTTVGRTDRPPW